MTSGSTNDAGRSDDERRQRALDALDAIAFLLERELAASHRVEAFRHAEDVVESMTATELRRRLDEGTLTEIAGIGPQDVDSHRGGSPGPNPCLSRRAAAHDVPEPGPGAELLALQRGDAHSHTDESDGGSPLRRMGMTARALGREWQVITDHSPTLTVANGLDAARLRAQGRAIDAFNAQDPGVRLLKGIECDILLDGALDQEQDLLRSLDLVVVSVHSKLRMPGPEMTERMVAAIANPATDVLGHCTGRRIVGRPRPPSDFDAEIVFAACQLFEVAVEINCRPDRLDPPMELLRQAAEQDCLFSIDTDAHAPGQLDWQAAGCERAASAGIEADRIVTTWPVERLLEWTARRR